MHILSDRHSRSLFIHFNLIISLLSQNSVTSSLQDFPFNRILRQQTAQDRAMIANNLHRGEKERTRRWEEERAASAQRAVVAASAAPAPSNATVAPLRASETKKSPPLLLPSAPTSPSTPASARRRLFSPLLHLRPLLLLGSTELQRTYLQRTYLRRRSPPLSFLSCPLRRQCPFCSTSPSICVVFLSRL